MNDSSDVARSAQSKKSDEALKRTVWKPALSTPFGWNWPEVSEDVSQKFLEELLKLLDSKQLPCLSPHENATEQSDLRTLGISEFRNQLWHRKRKRKPHNILGKTESHKDQPRTCVPGDCREKTRGGTSNQEFSQPIFTFKDEVPIKESGSALKEQSSAVLETHPLQSPVKDVRESNSMLSTIIEDATDCPLRISSLLKPSKYFKETTFKSSLMENVGCSSQSRPSQMLSRPTHTLRLRSGKEVVIPDYFSPQQSYFQHMSQRERTSVHSHFNIKRPWLLDHVITGVNSITKKLESEIQLAITSSSSKLVAESSHSKSQPRFAKRMRSMSDLGSQHSNSNNLVHPTSQICFSRLSSCVGDSSRISLIFVCTGDLNPLSLVEHLLPTVASLNRQRCLKKGADGSKLPHPLIYLIPLMKGAEKRIALALGVKRAATVALPQNITGINNLHKMAQDLVKPLISGSLASNSESVPSLIPGLPWIPTHVKHYKTTAPTDLRKAKLEKAQRKKNRKLKSKSSIGSTGIINTSPEKKAVDCKI
ncbi:hypothetical protein O181_062214 [Austropuccinia psidii MF-1]|uniref:Uncharacterized protein n=1 Tax=Austropuccinia psidii MF-1 TaxID=1389203 RepID=A0A9Q3EJY5_9BASI|nr:hypothetical protein [Austropuccinia psidii MF-1]